VGVHYLGSLGSGQILRKFFDYLGVTDSIPVSRMGKDGVIDRYFFNAPGTHPSHFDMPEGFAAYAENLKAAFPEDARCIDTIMPQIRKAADQLHSLELLKSSGADFSLLDQSEPFGKILDKLRCSPGLRSVLAIPSSWIGVPLADCPAYYHNIALASYVSSSWRLDCSGADMADALTARFKELGGQVMTNTEVDSINVESRVVKGVQLKDGEKLTADIVVAALHPKVVLQMLPQGAVKPSYANRIKGLQNTHGIFTVHAAVDAAAHPEIPHNLFNVDTDSEGNVLDIRYCQIRKSRKKGVNLLSILTSGNDALWQPWAHSTSGRRDTAYYARKQEHSELLLREAEQFFGKLQGLELLDSSTPLTLRDWMNSPDGSAYGVLRSASQVLGTALLNRTAVKGLFLAGQNVMAPGVIGTILGSFATVKLIVGADEFERSCRL
jgi:phytoene dehydrogenase-like protein